MGSDSNKTFEKHDTLISHLTLAITRNVPKATEMETLTLLMHIKWQYVTNWHVCKLKRSLFTSASYHIHPVLYPI